ncbi:MAG: hypothetical protein IRZ07_09665 [Microbispora sp.]|nr:hypothetical protein [Microbispora sp.]
MTGRYHDQAAGGGGRRATAASAAGYEPMVGMPLLLALPAALSWLVVECTLWPIAAAVAGCGRGGPQQRRHSGESTAAATAWRRQHGGDSVVATAGVRRLLMPEAPGGHGAAHEDVGGAAH